MYLNVIRSFFDKAHKESKELRDSKKEDIGVPQTQFVKRHRTVKADESTKPRSPKSSH